ncbi:MAG: peptidylprolyl isomerase [Saprospiraceae bacterium]
MSEQRPKFKILLNLFLLLLVITTGACNAGKSVVEIETLHGTMKLRLFESTPRHTQNFETLVASNFYDGTLFHRVIPGFMIQGGDPDSKTAMPGQMLGAGGSGDELQQEINAIHLRGALAAARQGDELNPERKSNSKQFFIVTGRTVTMEYLDAIAQTKGITYTAEQKTLYLTKGGEPSLDGDYTVFGQMIEGFETLSKISAEPCDINNRPLRNISMKIKIVKE